MDSVQTQCARCEDLAAKNQRLSAGLDRVQRVEECLSNRLDENENRWRIKVENLLAENEKLKKKDNEWMELMRGAMSSGLTGKVEKLTEENKKLKKEIKKLQALV